MEEIVVEGIMEPVMLEVIPYWGIRDPFSALSHLAGALLSLVGLVVLIRRGLRRGVTPKELAALALYGLSMVLAFTASTLFHVFIGADEVLVLFKKMDHAAIFLLIGGTCTVTYNAVEQAWRPALIAFTWAVILTAMVAKMVIWPMELWLSSAVYLSVGWVGAFGVITCFRDVGWRPLRMLLAGAVIFTLGAVVFATEWPVLWPGVVEGHEVFHLLVLGGAACHFAFVYRYCTDPEAACRPAACAPASELSAVRLMTAERAEGGEMTAAS